QTYRAPRNEAEQALAAIWQELLELDNISIYDDFFQLGGHSLLAIRVISAIRKAFNQEIPIRKLFDHPTIAGLAEVIAFNRDGLVMPPIEAGGRPEQIPLSFEQERLWFIDHLQGGAQYNMPWVFRIDGPIDVQAMEAAFRDIIQRHEVLRTIIKEKDGKGFQIVTNAQGWTMEFKKEADLLLSGQTLQEYIHTAVLHPFDLSNDVLLRATLVQVQPTEHVLITVLHHIAFDAWSISIIVKEFTELYQSRIANRAPDLPSLPVQYADFAIWQRNNLSGERFDTKLQYWQTQLEEVVPTELPADFERSAERPFTGSSVTLNIGKELSEAVRALADEEGVTLYMTLLSAFKVLLFRYTGSTDICVGTSTAGRQQQEVEGLVGFFVNMLALRSQVERQMTFHEFLQQVKETTLQAYKYQDVPFEKVVEALDIVRDRGRTAVFQIAMVLQNAPEAGELSLGTASLHPLGTGSITSEFDLTLDITASPEMLQLHLVYSTALYKQDTMQRLLAHFEQLLQAVVQDRNTQVEKLKLLSTTEAQQLQAFSLPVKGAHPDVERSVMALFSEQVGQTPNAIALQLGEEQLSYQQLEAKGNQLAHFLRDKGVQQDSVVAVSMERSIMLIITLLGVLKTGCSYVAIDPAYPAQRKKYILEDSGAQLLLTHEATFDELPDGVASIDLAAQLSTLSHYADGPVATTTTGAALAYIMYTSGSTGLPKGVEVTHSNITSLVKDTDFVQMNSSSVLLSTGSPSFDATTFEYWGMLLNGGRLIMCPENVLLDAARLKEEIKNRSVNTMWFTAGWFNELVDTDPSVFENLHTVIAGGDKLSVRHVQRLQSAYPTLQLVNGYGPTENTTFSLTYTINNIAGCASIPIGRPLPYRSAWVLDEQLQLCAIGVVGELYVGGAGLARGYRNRAELTTQKFVADPFNNEPGARLYRTGDRARWLPDGTLEFLGRTDEQVKIRGYRVEPGEIESVLQQYEGIQQAAVVVREDDKQNKQLIAYIVAATSVDPQAVLQHLQKSVPAYMVPSLLIPIEHLPLTSNGKVDRKQLASFAIDTAITSRYIAPRNDTEKTLAAIWQQLLDVEQVGVEDNFFELGGHSLLAIRVISAMRKELQCEIAIRDIFDHPTIAALCNRLDQQKDRQLQAAIQPAKRPDQIPLSFSQERLWFIDRLQGSLQYHIPAVFKLEGIVDASALEASFKEIIQRHEVLRTVINEQEGIGYQQVHPGNDWTMERTTETSILSTGSTVEEYIRGQVLRPFDLSADHMLRVILVEVTATSHILIAVIHHIAFDGWSISILVKELSEL
ncbi:MULTISPECIES: non-ribosomal peptide synthetase, partial [Niastella]